LVSHASSKWCQKARFEAKKKNFIPCFFLLTKHQNNKLFFYSKLFGVLTGCQMGTKCASLCKQGYAISAWGMLVYVGKNMTGMWLA
jgi:hypothetical protein